jgi:hypothetical protein
MIIPVVATQQSVDPSTEFKITNASVQHEVESTDIVVQSDAGKGAVIPIPPVSSRTISDSEDEFFDASSDSKPSSRRTVNNVSPMNPISEEPDRKDEGKGLIAAAASATALAVGTVMYNNKPASINRSISSEAEDKDISSPTIKEKIQELSNVAPSEKMYSKSETDVLIATAVALALAKVTSGNKFDVSLNDEDDEIKRHTCDMSFNNNNQQPDSTVVSSSSDVTRDDDEDEEGDNYGNVLVHLPREEDTITSLPYDELSRQHRDLPAVAAKVKLQEQQEQVKERPELTIGPTIVFAQEPEEPELTEADIPQRPANPPPIALLSRAGLSPTFTDNRSMSPSSMRSYNNKGKAPMEYSDLESVSAIPSHENLQRTAALQQHLDTKRGSISASSVSTTNTNEQLHSINSSQYDGNGAVVKSSDIQEKLLVVDYLKIGIKGISGFILILALCIGQLQHLVLMEMKPRQRVVKYLYTFIDI